MYCFGKFEETMDLSRIHLAVPGLVKLRRNKGWKVRVEMSFIGYLEVLLMALHPTSELSTMQWCVLIRFSPVRKSVLQYKQKVSKSRKKLWCSQFFQKTHYPEHLFFSKYAQDSEFRSFFGRIEKTMNCFQDLLTFSQK